MRERMSAARLADIEQIHKGGIALMDSKIARWSASGGEIHNLADSALDAVTDLLAELLEVTRERDEALTEAQEYRSTAQHWKQERDEAYNIPPLGEYRAVCEERDTLLIELKEMQDRYYEIRRVAEDQRASLRAEVEKCRTQLGDLHLEHGALRAVLAKYKAAVETLFDAIAHGDYKHREWLKCAIRQHFAALDGRDEKGKSDGK